MNKYLSNIDPQALEAMFKDWQSNPDSVSTEWQRFFEGFELARVNYSNTGSELLDAEFKVLKLIEGYRKSGHLFIIVVTGITGLRFFLITGRIKF